VSHSLVAGGSRGIGRVVARALGSAGPVSVLSRTFEGAEPGVEHFAADLRDRGSTEAAVAAAVDRNGPVENLVCLQRYRGEADDDTTWTGELETTLSATRTLMEQVVASSSVGGGTVILVGSIAADLVAPEQPLAYHVAKAGLQQMVRYYAVAFGPSGWRVNGVVPGAVLKAEAEDYYGRNPEVREAYARITPLGRMGSPEDVAAAVCFLSSEQASFVTGQLLVVDGGLSLLWQGAFATEAPGT
jgi:NAD(P)-dependent dehydrogenase (short-subunit alcohol dehydrogenase family)